MTHEELLRQSFLSVEVNDAYDEAALGLRDGSRLIFRHRVGERWAKVEPGAEDSLAAQLLQGIAKFRLNGKHLDISFQDGSRWEIIFNVPPNR